MLQFVMIFLLVFFANQGYSQLHRNFPLESKYGKLSDFSFPEMIINGQNMVMGTGGQIRDTNNLLIFPNQLNQTGNIRYQQDSMGLVYRIWFLTPNEAVLAQEEDAYQSQ